MTKNCMRGALLTMRTPHRVILSCINKHPLRYLFPGCDFQAEADTEELLLQKAAEHAASVHNVTELTGEIVATVKGCIRDI